MPADPDEPIAPAPRLNLGLLQTLGTLVLVVFVLHAARVVIIPIALSVLFVFILSPLVRLLESRGLGRMPSVIVTLLLAGLLMSGIGYVIGGQVVSLARDLPNYKPAIQKKINGLRGSSGPFSELFKMFDELAEGDGAGKNPLPEGATKTPGGRGPRRADRARDRPEADEGTRRRVRPERAHRRREG